MEGGHSLGPGGWVFREEVASGDTCFRGCWIRAWLAFGSSLEIVCVCVVFFFFFSKGQLKVTSLHSVDRRVSMLHLSDVPEKLILLQG